MEHAYRVRYDGALSTVVVCPPDDPDAFATFGEAKAELVGHVRIIAQEWARALRWANNLTAAQVKEAARNDYGIEF